jgi:DNA-binding MarR family transcriptional regulator
MDGKDGAFKAGGRKSMSRQRPLKAANPEAAGIGQPDPGELAEEEVTSARTCSPQVTKEELRELASRIYDARRTRGKILGRKLFGEPAWDMLLALYCLPVRGLVMSVTTLNYCADVPQTTGHRWQQVLACDGLIERGPKQMDARRQVVRLTPRGTTLMEKYLGRLLNCPTGSFAGANGIAAPVLND